LFWEISGVEGSRFSQNVGNNLPDYTVSHHRKQIIIVNVISFHVRSGDLQYEIDR
jgi:hypothetical protein